MRRKSGKRINDGNKTGLKQDKFRNSRFEYEPQSYTRFGGVSRSTLNTLGGAYEENRGHRAADPRWAFRESPFENLNLANWNHRQGWDRYFDADYDKDANRPHGGALVGHDIAHQGKGPKGYARSDKRIYEDVCEALSLSRAVDPREVEVTVKDGCVFLNGSIATREMKRMAELEIENISGVKDVQNLLSVNPPGEGEGNVRH